MEKEYLVRVAFGAVSDNVQAASPVQIARLRHGLSLDGQALKPAWWTGKNPEQLRFVLNRRQEAPAPAHVRDRGPEGGGTQARAHRRVGLGQLPLGQWRYLAPQAREGAGMQASSGWPSPWWRRRCTRPRGPGVVARSAARTSHGANSRRRNSPRATGIRVLQTRKPTGEALAQLRAEAANPKTDLVGHRRPVLPGGGGGPAGAADYLGDLHGWAVRQYAMSANHVGGFYTSAIGFGWNEEVLKKKVPAPKCWKDLLDPRYKGEIETSHPASSGTTTILAGLVQMMGEEAAFDYLNKLHRNVTQYTRSGTAQARSVARGKWASA